MVWYSLHRNDPAFKERKRQYDKLRRASLHPHLRYYYGITFEEYAAMLVSQNGVCAICGKPESATNQYGVKRLAVDHDHATKCVRGLLCSKCNRAIGLLDEDTGRMLRAVAYLAKGDSDEPG
jgi:hypothetical protein